MSEVLTSPAKYIFLDVVGFTQVEIVEAQSDIIHALNNIVRASIEHFNIEKDRLILSPAGDGICIALLNIEDPYDIHMQIALDIIQNVQKYNDNTEKETRKFQIRIGLNANIDNLITDINGNRNIAGAGINMAERIMSQADGNQILVGRSVYDTLRYREQYISSFKDYNATVKHGVQLSVFQFVQEGHVGLITDAPVAFQVREKEDKKLNIMLA